MRDARRLRSRFDAIATRVLGAIERLIGGSDDAFEGLRVDRILRNPDRHGYAWQLLTLTCALHFLHASLHI
jgi:hypothetical protein